MIEKIFYWLAILTAFTVSAIMPPKAHAAHEQIPATPYYRGWYATIQVGDWTPDINSAGQQQVANRNTYGSQQVPAWATCTFGTMQGRDVYGTCGNTYGFISTVQREYRCPDGYTVGGDMCTHDAPPPPDCEDKAGQTALQGRFTDSDRDGELTPITCVESCQAVLSSSGPGGPSCYFGESGIGICEYTIDGTYIYTGAECAGGESTPAPAPPTPPDCPQCECFEQGGSYGTVNGIATCVPQGTPGSPPVQTTEPPIKQTTTPPPTEENPDPEPVTNTSGGGTVTVVPPATAGGQPQVQETKTNPDGSTTTTTATIGQFCQQNSTHQLCAGGGGGSSLFGGQTCQQQPSCSGDPIQCAQVFQAWKNRCAVELANERVEDAADWAQDLIDNNPANPLSDSEKVIQDLGELDTSDLFGASPICPAPVAFTALGQSLSISFDKFCWLAEIIGNLIVIAAVALAMRLIYGGL